MDRGMSQATRTQPSEAGKRRSPRWLAILFLGIAVVTATVLASIPFWFKNELDAELRISSLYLEPGQPRSGEEIVVTAIISGKVDPNTVRVDFAFKAFFGDSFGAHGSMSPAWNNQFQVRIGPFANGTEVWVVASALAPVAGRAFPETLSFSVGEVRRGGPSALSIPGWSWGGGTSDGLDFSVLAEVISDEQVTQVVVALVVWGENGDALLDHAMVDQGAGHYEASFTLPNFKGPDFYSVRVAAADVSGNTAVQQASAGLS